MKRILILFLLILSFTTVKGTEDNVKPFTESCVNIGYKLDEFSPSKLDKKIEKKKVLTEEESNELTPEEKRKIKAAVKSMGISFLQAAFFFLFCGIACLIAMMIYMFIVRIIIGLQHKYAKKS
jgi:hypothetical protein